MARAVHVPTGTGGVQAATASSALYGYSIRENAGTPAAATVILRDGTDATGAPLALIELAANQSIAAVAPGAAFATGLFADRVAGETELVLYVG